MQTATWANFFSTNGCIYLSTGRSFSLNARFRTEINLARQVFLVPTLHLSLFLYKAMENCQLGDSNLAGSIFISWYVARCQQVRAGDQGSGILSFIPSCAYVVLSPWASGFFFFFQLHQQKQDATSQGLINVCKTSQDFWMKTRMIPRGNHNV